jgi:hypothetical protein
MARQRDSNPSVEGYAHRVRTLLRLEGLAVLALSVYGYATGEGRWLWFVVLFLIPGLSNGRGLGQSSRR